MGYHLTTHAGENTSTSGSAYPRFASRTPGLRVFLMSFLLAVLLAGCGGEWSGHVTRWEGQWGGAHISMLNGAECTTIDYDCAHGAMDVPVELQDDGSFVASGSHTRESGGPVREGDMPAPLPARYEGRVTGDAMTLSVILIDTGDVLGPYVLTYGSAGQVFKCL